MSHFGRRALALGTAAATLGATTAHAQNARSYVLTTATIGGTYYPVGVALATLIKVKLQAQLGLDMSAISSAGSTENVRLMRENQAQFAILQGLVAQFAGEGAGPFANAGVQRNIRGILPLWYNFEQFVVERSLATTGRIMDMKNLEGGRRFSMGARGSGLETMHLWLFPNLGVDHTKMDLVYQGYGPSAESLMNGNIHGTNFEAGLPTPAVTQAFARAGDRLRFLQWNDEDIRRGNGRASLLVKGIIPAGTYPTQTTEWTTAKLPNYFACNAAVPEEDVYLVTKTIFENLPFLNNIHAATREINLQESLGGYPFPLHPGAIRYYRERGLNVPANLVPS
ncbi:TAXI family TRAP transporter solute-binding subunit [Roseococcus thiosulfatophilus]|uniref:TAXI family TRAP transporter solute-binding subunit n=1 Tax=Roseococcus thiosulfatophilus TaxID=35813 RepID=UPI001A8DDFBC|nr:TAXI family TRAP transporter solute-binding subunit [Roseococcus thiosulfatophilus]